MVPCSKEMKIEQPLHAASSSRASFPPSIFLVLPVIPSHTFDNAFPWLERHSIWKMRNNIVSQRRNLSLGRPAKKPLFVILYGKGEGLFEMGLKWCIHAKIVDGYQCYQLYIVFYWYFKRLPIGFVIKGIRNFKYARRRIEKWKLIGPTLEIGYLFFFNSRGGAYRKILCERIS